MEIRERLLALQDGQNAAFVARLIPNISAETVLGVRAPALRALVRQLRGSAETAAFLQTLPHEYLDENILHAFLISDLRDYAECLAAVEAFLPCVDNWAVCDSLRPRAFSRNREKLLPEVGRWIASEETYTRRFGVGMVMAYFLDEHFAPEQLDWVVNAQSGEYYVNMMRAWYFATALAKQYEAALPLIEARRLDAWTHNKTIQKAIESYRIPDERKAYLRRLKEKKQGDKHG